MNICLCFIGLQRTFEKTYKNIIESLIHNDGSKFYILYVTWESENTDLFKNVFPFATIAKFPDITMEYKEFQSWKKNLQMHISWRRTYEPDMALFRYFQQIYLWKQTAIILKQLSNTFDIIARLRTDVRYSSPIYPIYHRILATDATSIYFSKYQEQYILNEGECCPDQFFIGKPDAMIKILEIMDYVDLYKINYIERKRKWFTNDTLETNILQPESTLYYFLKGENLSFTYLDTEIEVVR